MKKMQAGSFLLLIVTLAAMAVNRFVVPLPDWAVRTAGVAMMLALFCMAYSIVKGGMER